MAQDIHTLEVVNGSNNVRTDRLIVGVQTGIANAAGGGAGTAVTTAVTFDKELPASYAVFVTVDNTVSASVSITGKTSSGFNVVLTPNPSTATLAAGTFDVLVVG
jgi:hypothetical protein